MKTDGHVVVLRNPWGDSEWTGKWSDGSKEWTEEWLPALKVLQHKFGDDGEFVMECECFFSFPFICPFHSFLHLNLYFHLLVLRWSMLN